ncbi:MAG: hypothetical protein H6562_01375 [Lewinellaceae bacterium]|nr:hypothetical protein [Lewinellaceae bacterium]
MQALNIHPRAEAAKAAARYGGAEILLSEEKREQARQARLDELRKTFVEGPTLLFPGAATVTIPGGGVASGDRNDIFRSFSRLRDLGKLEAEKGCLYRVTAVLAVWRRRFSSIKLLFSGDGWKLYLSPGWTVKEGERMGSYEVVKE